MSERLEGIKEDVGTNAEKEHEFITKILFEDALWLIKQAERVQDLEKEFERYDITNHKIGMTINNPNTSDDEKWDKVNELLPEAWESDCIHCNGKGFNGLDYCPNCVRGEIIQENFKLERENKRYREARKRIEEKYDAEYDAQNQEYMGGIADGLMIVMNIIDEALEESE